MFIWIQIYYLFLKKLIIFVISLFGKIYIHYALVLSKLKKKQIKIE
jgi:hypothetical protein